MVPSGSAWPHGRLLLRQRLMAVAAATFQRAALPSMCVLRRARPGDSTVVSALDASAFGSNVADGRAWLEPLCLSDRAKVAIVELEGVPVATGYALSCHSKSGLSVYIGGIAVIPSARRRGIGTALSSWLLDLGFEEGAAFAHLQTDSPNAARSIERLGFEDFRGIDIYDGQ